MPKLSPACTRNWDANLNAWVPQDGVDGDERPANTGRLHFDSGPNAMPSGKFCFDAFDDMYIAGTKNHILRN